MDPEDASEFLRENRLAWQELAEVNPFTSVFGGITPKSPVLRYPYFGGDEPETYDEEGTYADRDAEMEHTWSHGLAHPLGDVVSALCATDLEIAYLHEPRGPASRRSTRWRRTRQAAGGSPRTTTSRSGSRSGRRCPSDVGTPTPVQPTGSTNSLTTSRIRPVSSRWAWRSR